MTSKKIIVEAVRAHDPSALWDGLEKLKIRLRIRGNILMIKLKCPTTRELEITVSTEKLWI